MQSKCKAMQSKCTRLVFVLILSNYLIINKTVVLFRYAVFKEVDDIIQSPIVKESIINNSDCKILLDQRKYMTKFDGIQAMLGLSEKEKSQILSINQNNDPNRLYKEVWIGLGGMQSAVYATEVSMEEYLTYTTEETEKVEVMNRAAQLGGDIETAIRQLAIEKRNNKKK